MFYVCSDIHGHLDKFKKMLDVIGFSPDDQMYVIGDAIDRGPRPIETLLYIFSHQNITFLPGNHEMMMLEARGREEEVWMENGGRVTYRQLQRLSDDQRSALFRKIKKCPVVIPDVLVNRRKFYLAHALPVSFVIERPLLYDQCTTDMLNQCLWERRFTKFGDHPSEIYATNVLQRYRNYTVIVGHTPTSRSEYGVVKSNGQPRISRTHHGHLINIDCGCAGGKNLGCLRLDDFKEYYVD